VGLIGVARTAAEGAAKYGRLNYVQGLPVHDLLNHTIGHIVQFLLGDRTQPHLEHAAWGVLAAIQSHTLDPDLSSKHLLGPGATLSAANLDHLESQAPALKAARDAGEFADSGSWNLRDVPEISGLLAQRTHEQFGQPPFNFDDDDPFSFDKDEDDRLLPAEEPLEITAISFRDQLTEMMFDAVKKERFQS